RLTSCAGTVTFTVSFGFPTAPPGSRHLGAARSLSSCPPGQLTRPWKWFTRQTRVSHWKDRLSTFVSVTWKPLNASWYSSSGTHGSPTPPGAQPALSQPASRATASEPRVNLLVIDCSL